MIKLLLITLIFLQTCKQGSPSASGTLKGIATIGPMCPVEPCNLTENQKKVFYSGFRVIIFAGDDEVKKLSISPEGTFSNELRPGTYQAVIHPVEGQALNPPERHAFTIEKGKISTIRLSYDTGIR